MILICYDGSTDAQAAIEHGARLLKGEEATVLTIWQQFVTMVAQSPSLGLGSTAIDPEKIDEENRKYAEDRAEDGVRLAAEVGVKAQARVVPQGINTTSQAILAEAESMDASAIVMGSRGLTGVKSLLLGSVSHAVIQHADRPVVVVPSPEVAARRARELRDEERAET
jgi:nucleotide-binding universal stress UspA family protein